MALAVAVLPTVAVSPAGSARAQDGDGLYELVDAATQRLQTADAVAASKWINGGPITDPVRAQQVLAAVAHDAQSAGVSPDYVTALFTDQINASEAIQYNRFSWWKLDAAAAPVTAPDLAGSRAQIDGLNRRMVGEIAEQWPALQSPDCAARLAGAKSAVAGARGLDPLYRQALDTATRSYCNP